MTSHDLVKWVPSMLYRKLNGIGQTPCSYERYLVHSYIHSLGCMLSPRPGSKNSWIRIILLIFSAGFVKFRIEVAEIMSKFHYLLKTFLKPSFEQVLTSLWQVADRSVTAKSETSRTFARSVSLYGTIFWPVTCFRQVKSGFFSACNLSG